MTAGQRPSGRRMGGTARESLLDAARQLSAARDAEFAAGRDEDGRVINSVVVDLFALALVEPGED